MEKIRRLEGHSDSVYGVLFAPDGKRLLSVSRDGTAVIWNVDQADVEHRIMLGGHVIGLSFSSDGTWLAVGNNQGDITVSRVQDGKVVRTFNGPPLECLAFRPQSDELWVGGGDNHIHRWQILSGRRLPTQKVSRPQTLSISFSHDGKTVCLASGRGGIEILGVVEGKALRSFDLQGMNPVVYRAVLDPIGEMCIASLHYKEAILSGVVDRYEVVVWDLARDDKPSLTSTLVGHLGWIGGLDYAPKRELIATGSYDHSIALWDAQRQHRLAESEEHAGAVYGVCFSPDEFYLASCSADRSVLVQPVDMLLQSEQNPSPPSTGEILAHLSNQGTHGQAGIAGAANQIVDRLSTCRSRLLVERELRPFLPLLEFRVGGELLNAILRNITVRLEERFRAGDKERASFFHWLQRAVDTIASEWIGSDLIHNEAARSFKESSDSMPVPDSSDLHAADVWNAVEQAMSSPNDLSGILASTSKLELSEEAVARALERLRAKASGAVRGTVDPRSVAAGADALLALSISANASPPLVGSIEALQGIILSLLGDLVRAVEVFERALKHVRTGKDPKSISATLGDLGNSYRNAGRLRDSQRAYTEALEMAEAPGLESLRVNHRTNLSIVYGDLGDVENQEKCLTQARLEARTLHLNGPLATITNQLGDLYHRLGNYDDAVEMFGEALEMSVTLGDDRLRLAVLGNLGRTLRKLDRTDEAEQKLAEVLLLSERVNAPSAIANALIELGYLKSKSGQHEEARQLVLRAIAIPQAVQPTIRFSALVALGNIIAAGESKTEAAIMAWEQAATIGESLRGEIRRPNEGSEIQSDLAEVYTSLLRAYLREGRAEEALLASERGRAALLVRRLRENGQTKELATVSRLDQQLTISGLVEQLRQLGMTAVLVIYAFDYDRLYLFVLRADDGEIRLEAQPIDQERLSQFRDDFTREIVDYGSRGDLGETWHGLSQIVIDPLLPHLKESDTIFWIPDGPLHGLPLHALFADKKRVIERWPVAYLPSASALSSLAHNVKGSPQRAFVCGIHFTDEAKDVAKVLCSTRKMIGEHAAKDRLLNQLSRADLIHISAYGFFSRKDPTRSGLVLEPVESVTEYLKAREKPDFELTGSEYLRLAIMRPQADATVLTASDVEKLTLPASFITLSACESGLVSMDQANDPVGLLSAFLVSGAKTVVASLWLVDPDTTRRMMLRMYEHLMSTNDWVHKPQALRTAMLDVMGRYPHPYYWAAFMLVGGAARGVANHGGHDALPGS